MKKVFLAVDLGSLHLLAVSRVGSPTLSHARTLLFRPDLLGY